MIATPLKLVKDARMYFEKQNNPIAYKTFGKRMNLTPKEARYVLRVYFKTYEMKPLHRLKTTKRYYMEPSSVIE